ncbi:MAG TPA: hypothetical protein VF624_04150 [Tepidisphaeraceae bacterium]|jgi:uncharacterized protein YndB with AHSA1/START domain
MSKINTPAPTALAADSTNLVPVVKRGSLVHIVTPNDGHIEAEVTKVHGDRRIDVIYKFRGKGTELTQSPYDPTGTQSDSWHVAD